MILGFMGVGFMAYRRKCRPMLRGDRWLDDVRLSDIKPRFTCQACGMGGADVRPDFHWEKEQRTAIPVSA